MAYLKVETIAIEFSLPSGKWYVYNKALERRKVFNYVNRMSENRQMNYSKERVEIFIQHLSLIKAKGFAKEKKVLKCIFSLI